MVDLKYAPGERLGHQTPQALTYTKISGSVRSLATGGQKKTRKSNVYIPPLSLIKTTSDKSDDYKVYAAQSINQSINKSTD